MSVTVLDTKGLNCPLPVLKVKKAVAGMSPGARLQVLATDPGAVQDFQNFARASGNKLINWTEDAGVFTFEFEKT